MEMTGSITCFPQYTVADREQIQLCEMVALKKKTF